jgi:hypothetical protein
LFVQCCIPFHSSPICFAHCHSFCLFSRVSFRGLYLVRLPASYVAPARYALIARCFLREGRAKLSGDYSPVRPQAILSHTKHSIAVIFRPVIRSVSCGWEGNTLKNKTRRRPTASNGEHKVPVVVKADAQRERTGLIT